MSSLLMSLSYINIGHYSQEDINSIRAELTNRVNRGILNIELFEYYTKLIDDKEEKLNERT